MFGFIRGETEYLISAIPLGGYVKFYGENAMGDEEDIDALSEDEKKRTADVDEKRNFSNIHPFKRILTVVAGPLFNIIFASVLFTMIFLIGFNMPGTKIGKVIEDDPAHNAGVKAGDEILEIDGEKAGDWEDVHHLITTGKDEKVKMKIRRAGETLDIAIEPKWVSEEDELGEETKKRMVGIVNSGEPEDMIIRSFGIKESIVLGVAQTIDYSVLTYKGIIKLLTREISLRENIGGPIMIVQMTGEFAQKGLVHLLNFVGVISISLGIINLLPIPILDGGAIIFFTVELIMRKPISLKKRMIAQQIGLILLVALMLFAVYNDIARIVSS
jgi:regulator of sigma E protease